MCTRETVGIYNYRNISIKSHISLKKQISQVKEEVKIFYKTKESENNYINEKYLGETDCLPSNFEKSSCGKIENHLVKDRSEKRNLVILN